MLKLGWSMSESPKLKTSSSSDRDDSIARGCVLHWCRDALNCSECKQVARPLPSSLLDLQTNVVHIATCCTEPCTTYTSGPAAQKVITIMKTDQWQSREGKTSCCIFKSNYVMPRPKLSEEQLQTIINTASKSKLWNKKNQTPTGVCVRCMTSSWNLKLTELFMTCAIHEAVNLQLHPQEDYMGNGRQAKKIYSWETVCCQCTVRREFETSAGGRRMTWLFTAGQCDVWSLDSTYLYIFNSFFF